MQTYGMHSIHGRAPAIPTGLKIAPPDLSGWVVTGDGDALAIGGNHFIHAMRRNMDLKVIMLNNRIYGLTKGQYSPTSEEGKKTKSTPLGSIDRPFNPVALALGAGATLVARTTASDQAPLQMVLARAAQHKGSAFVEVLQNCIVFNDGAYESLADKATRDNARVLLEHGKPLVYGTARDRGIRLQGLKTQTVALGADGAQESSLLVHDESAEDGALAYLLAHLGGEDAPLALGVFRSVAAPTYQERNAQQASAARRAKGRGELAALLHGGDTWDIKQSHTRRTRGARQRLPKISSATSPGELSAASPSRARRRSRRRGARSAP
jgi:2-oxoglutarate ferredoxin oxidoreductase subunit beta